MGGGRARVHGPACVHRAGRYVRAQGVEADVLAGWGRGHPITHTHTHTNNAYPLSKRSISPCRETRNAGDHDQPCMHDRNQPRWGWGPSSHRTARRCSTRASFGEKYNHDPCNCMYRAWMTDSSRVMASTAPLLEVYASCRTTTHIAQGTGKRVRADAFGAGQGNVQATGKQQP
jgi:hypothetical protein